MIYLKPSGRSEQRRAAEAERQFVETRRLESNLLIVIASSRVECFMLGAD
jgi:hypothetical protein